MLTTLYVAPQIGQLNGDGFVTGMEQINLK